MKKAIFSYRKTFHFFLWIRSKPSKVSVLRFFYLHSMKENIKKRLMGLLQIKNTKNEKSIYLFIYWHFYCDSHYLETMVRLLTLFTKYYYLSPYEVHMKSFNASAVITLYSCVSATPPTCSSVLWSRPPCSLLILVWTTWQSLIFGGRVLSNKM